MNNTTLSSIFNSTAVNALAITVACVLGSEQAASAASLQGRVGINPFNKDGEEAGVTLIGSGLRDANNNPVVSYDFVPPTDRNTPVTGGTTGAIVELNANSLNPLDPNSPNDFVNFVGQTGTIQDLSFTEIASLGSIDDFILVENSFSFQLNSLGLPVYSFNQQGTTISLGAEGTFFNLSDGSNDASQGVGTLSIDFAGLTPAQVVTLFDENNEISPAFDPTTWSSNFVAVADGPDTPIVVVNESSTLFSLALLSLGSFFCLGKVKFS